MRRKQLRQIIRDVDVACAIRPIMRRHLLTLEATVDMLTKCGVERAGSVARLAMAIF
jgi:hypothetical protein